MRRKQSLFFLSLSALCFYAGICHLVPVQPNSDCLGEPKWEIAAEQPLLMLLPSRGSCSPCGIGFPTSNTKSCKTTPVSAAGSDPVNIPNISPPTTAASMHCRKADWCSRSRICSAGAELCVLSSWGTANPLQGEVSAGCNKKTPTPLRLGLFVQ